MLFAETPDRFVAARNELAAVHAGDSRRGCRLLGGREVGQIPEAVARRTMDGPGVRLLSVEESQLIVLVTSAKALLPTQREHCTFALLLVAVHANLLYPGLQHGTATPRATYPLFAHRTTTRGGRDSMSGLNATLKPR